MASKYNVVFKGLGAVASTESGSTILDSALSAGIALRAPCGGGGTCGKCAVRVVDGDIPPSSECGQFFSDEELNRGWRLACRCEITCDATIEVPQETLLEQDVLALTATGGDGARSASEPFAKRRVIGIGDLEKEDWKAPLERLDIPDEDGSPDWKKALDDAAKKGDTISPSWWRGEKSFPYRDNREILYMWSRWTSGLPLSQRRCWTPVPGSAWQVEDDSIPRRFSVTTF